MPSQRVLFAKVLREERIDLWQDLYLALDRNEGQTGEHVTDLVRRIWVIGEALGEATDCDRVPIRMLRWVEMLETRLELGLHYQRPDLTILRAEHGHLVDDQLVPERRIHDYFHDHRRLPSRTTDPDDESWYEG